MSAFKSYIPSAVRFEVSNYKIRHNLDMDWLRNASAIAKAMPYALQCQNTGDTAKSIAERISVRNTQANIKERERLEEDKRVNQVSRYISNFYFVYDSAGKRHIKFGVEPEGHDSMSFYTFSKKEGTAAKAEQIEEEKEPVKIPESYDVAARIGDKICKRLDTNQASGDVTVRGKKYMDAKFWRRKLNSVVNPLREEYLYKLGMIKKGRTHYASSVGQRIRASALRAQKQWAAQHIVKSESGDFERPLSEIIDEKEKGYRAKITAKAAGLNKYAKKHGMTAAMITVTCPGTFRRDGTTIQGGLDHLRAVWKRALAEINKQTLTVAGLMVWQPHKDALPHQHIYMIGSQNDISVAYDIINDKALATYPDEKGGKEKRTSIKWQDDKLGSLSSYGLSYVIRYAKDEDEDDGDETSGEACEMDGSAEDSWYAMNRCRRIGWFGLPSDVHWENCAQVQDWKLKEIKDKKLLKMIEAAKDGDYCKWMTLAGGIAVKRKERRMSSIRVERETQYGEKGWRYIGSEINNIEIIIRNVVPMLIEKLLAVVIPNYPRGVKTKVKDSVLPVSQSAAP